MLRNLQVSRKQRQPERLPHEATRLLRLTRLRPTRPRPTRPQSTRLRPTKLLRPLRLRSTRPRHRLHDAEEHSPQMSWLMTTCLAFGIRREFCDLAEHQEPRGQAARGRLRKRRNLRRKGRRGRPLRPRHLLCKLLSKQLSQHHS